VPIKDRLGTGEKSRSEQRDLKDELKDLKSGTMSITLDSKSTKRQVDEKKTDLEATPEENLEVVEEVGEETVSTAVVENDEEERERKELMEKERQLKERLLEEEKKRKEGPAEEVDLNKVVINKRSRRSESSNADSKVLTVKTPDNLVAKLAQKLKELPQPAVVPKQKTDRQKSAIKKKMKERYAKEASLPERILYLALEKVMFDEERANLLISKLLKDTKQKESGMVEEIVLDVDNDMDELDFEADEPEA